MRSTIVIPNFNGYNYLINCLNSVNAQIALGKDEIILVDNGSTDQSVSFIEQNYSNVRILKLDRNYGFSRAVNEGIKASRGKYVILLNNDTEVMPGWLEMLIKCLETDDHIFSVSSQMIKFNDREIIDDAGDEFTLLGWAYKRGDGRKIESYIKEKEVFSTCAGAAAYRKSVLDSIGYFDESFFAYLEDVDLGYRARILGFKNVYCPEAKVFHIGSATSGSKYNDFKVELTARNTTYLIYKNMPILQIVINFPFLVIGFIFKYLFFLINGYGKIYLRGLYRGIKNLKSIEPTKYNRSNLKNYFRIQYILTINSIKYFVDKIFGR